MPAGTQIRPLRNLEHGSRDLAPEGSAISALAVHRAGGTIVRRKASGRASGGLRALAICITSPANSRDMRERSCARAPQHGFPTHPFSLASSLFFRPFPADRPQRAGQDALPMRTHGPRPSPYLGRCAVPFRDSAERHIEAKPGRGVCRLTVMGWSLTTCHLGLTNPQYESLASRQVRGHWASADG